MKNGTQLITEERQRQIEKEGWTAEHDAEHTEGEISLAAAIYAMPNKYLKYRYEGFFSNNHKYKIPELWPWNEEWYKPTDDRIRELTKAGALIAAEIDRLQLKKAETDAY